MSPIIYTPHDCQPPTPEEGTPEGTLYQCPRCSRVHTLEVDVYPAPAPGARARRDVYWRRLEDPERDAAIRSAYDRVRAIRSQGTWRAEA